ncbi:MAG TPA: serine hydrolase domain-containing protein [Roseiflexaceae bacterium]|nr:serine hydrolase domain-containing protein [Roseiflexaceae bacterium]
MPLFKSGSVSSAPPSLLRILLLCVLLASLLAAPAPARAADPGVDPALAAALEQLLEQTVVSGRIPGAALAVSIPGQGTWAGARGLADRDGGLALAPDTIFSIASISKLFVATVALQLVQEGWLSLDQTVERWLPGMIAHGDRIAVRHLMNHTSGLPDYLDESFAEAALADRGRVWAPHELVASALERRSATAVGRWRYSNTNYVLLGMIVEQVTHNSLARELHQRIIDPLGLSHTFVAPDDPLPAQIMHGYEGRRDETMGREMSFAWGAGSILSSVEDLARFAGALFGGVLLRPETLATMRTFVGTRGWDPPDLTYGLGVMRMLLRAAQPMVALGHTGALIGYRTALWYLPNTGVTIAVALNQMTADPDRVAAKALDALRAHGVGQVARISS